MKNNFIEYNNFIIKINFVLNINFIIDNNFYYKMGSYIVIELLKQAIYKFKRKTIEQRKKLIYIK